MQFGEKANITFDKTDIEKNKGVAIVSYIIFFLPFLTKAKNSVYAKFHAKQSIMIVILYAAMWVIYNVLVTLAWSASFLRVLLLTPASLLWMVGSLSCLACVIIGMLNAANGEGRYLPVIGKYAEKILKF